ncbi:MAG TPA: rRNA maturation RNase YbeY [Gemmatimonadaceae bacterium]|nr:rRNA maturation RNase YbeY [Gemmatimonadaceae bacterium]
MSSIAVRPAIHVAVDGVATPLSRARARAVVEGVLRAEKVRRALVSVAFVGDRAITTLNATHLGHRGPTDVISFGFERPTPGDPVVGDIYIAPRVAARNARARKVGVREELTRLLVHGTLHVLGHDHPDDEEREHSAMWKRQERLVRRLSGTGAR